MSSRAQSRYQTQLKTKKLPDGRTVYVPSLLKTIETGVEDVVITADAEDRADIIAHNVYGSSVEWWRIAAANGKFGGSLHFTPGQEITIPRKT